MTYLRKDGGYVNATGAALGGGTGKPEILWAVDGVLQAGRSNRYRFASPQTLTEFVAFLEETAGVTDTVLEIRKNGVVAATVTLLAGVTEITTAQAIEYDTGDELTLAIKVPGVGADSLQTISRFG